MKEGVCVYVLQNNMLVFCVHLVPLFPSCKLELNPALRNSATGLMIDLQLWSNYPVFVLVSVLW